MHCQLHQRVQNSVHPLSLSPTNPGCISSSCNRNRNLQRTSPGASSPGCHMQQQWWPI
ncbi:hypothetical protein BC830DRAFT_1144061, partial [Chytriomyces sp. MP71]